MRQIAATSRLVCTAAATGLLALFCPCDVARIQTSLNSCDRSQRQNSVAGTKYCDKSPRLHCCCDRVACAILSLRYVARIQTSLNSCDRSQRQHSVAGTKYCRSDNDFHMSHEAICRIVCLGLYPSWRYSTNNERVAMPSAGVPFLAPK